MRILVTGAEGDLGRAFLSGLPAHHEILALGHEELDVGSFHPVMQAVTSFGPEIVFNLAAMTQVDECELEPESAYRSNAIGAQNLALAARACDAALVQLSTDYVFDGSKGSPYDEVDIPAPLSVYGRSKLAGERLVRDVLPSHFIVRTAHLFGGGSDYASQAISRLRAGDPAGGIADRFGSPTYVPHLAARLLPLAITGRFGTFHLAGRERASWFELLRSAREMGGLPGEVEPQRAASLGLVAPRPADSSLTSVLLPHLGIEPMPALETALKELLETGG